MIKITRLRMTLASCFAIAGVVAACTAAQLQQAGVPANQATQIATVTQDAVNAGTLFCQLDTTLAQVSNINVIGASSAAVAQACTVAGAIVAAAKGATPATTAATPTPATAGAQAVVVAVPAATVAAVNATKGG